MKLLAWNVNHRAARRPIPPWLIRAIAAESPDVVSLTEYVVGPDHDRFLGELANSGLLHSALTARLNGSNQVLVASREPLTPGAVQGATFNENIPPNFLNVQMMGTGLDVIGFRMPAYVREERPVKRLTWEWLIDAVRPLREHPTVLLGDFNTAFGDPPSRCGDCLDAMIANGWVPAVPTDGFSWRGYNGGTGRRIDLAFLSPSVKELAVSYSWSFRDLGEEASAMRVGRPDHAMLLLEVTGSWAG